MKRIIRIIAVISLLAGASVSCVKPDDNKGGIDWEKVDKDKKDEDKDDPSKRSPLETPKYRVAAHRGGASESKFPDNSIASLGYAIRIGAATSECDIYWTKDNDVVVAHADGNNCINGLTPWTSTLEEIRAKGRLANGESIPSLSDYIDYLLANTKCTKLMLDIKYLPDPQNAIRAAARACQIIKEKKAVDYCEFICTSNATTMTSAHLAATAAGIPIAWMGNYGPATYRAKNYPWANLNYEWIYKDGARKDHYDYLTEFPAAGVEMSVFTVDSETDLKEYAKYYANLKYICTNYPQRAMKILSEAGF